MTARNIKTGEIYEGGKVFIASIIGVHRNTLTNWQNKGVTIELYNNYEVRFTNVIRNI